MLFNNKYPYTDFHELNLDWLLQEIGQLRDYVYGEHSSFTGSTEPVNSILYGRPVVPEKTDFVNLAELNYDEFISMWDELVSANPDYFEKRTWTDSTSGYSNYIYKWHARNIKMIGKNTAGQYLVENFYRSYDMYPGLTIIGAIHGDEKSSIFAFYRFFKWCLDPANAAGQWILDNYSFDIAPVINIYGFNNNTRYNGNGVNINRNFPHGWEDYPGGDPGTDRAKGPSPLSEWEARFAYAIIEDYTNVERYTFPILDLHSHHYTLHDDKRVTWYVSNDIQFKEASLFINSFLYDKIIKELPFLEPDYNAGQIFTRWVSSISTPSFDNEARVHGIKDMALETPQRFVSGIEYDEHTQYISDLIVWNVVLNILDYSRECPQGKTYYTLYKVGIDPSSDYTIADICDIIPRGSKLVLGIKSDHYLNTSGQLPKLNGENIAGVLEFVKSGSTEETNVTAVRFTSYSQNYTYTWETSSGSSGTVHPWVSKQGVMSGEDLVRYYNYINNTQHTTDTINFTQLVSVLPVNLTAELYVSAVNFPYVYAEVGLGPGIIKMSNPYSSGLIRKCATFLTADGDYWTTFISSSGDDIVWNKAPKVYTNTDTGLVNILTDVFPGLKNGDKFLGYFSANETTNRGITPPADVGYATYELTKYANPSGSSEYGVLICQTVGAQLKRYVCRVQSDGTQGTWSEIVLS